jgi:hypothetical protein
MHLLTRDQELLERKYPNAWNHIIAASLRKEAYALALNKHRNAWETSRLNELLKTPACRECWFVIQLRGDAPQIEELLLGTGL